MALGEDRRQGDGLGSSSSSMGQQGNHTVNTQGNLVFGRLEQAHTPATRCCPGCPAMPLGG